MDRSYGRLVPVAAERVLTTEDGWTLDFAGRPLRFIDTPGHARHHHCVWDEASRGWFTGDTFGLSYREFDVDGRAWIFPTSTPVQFEPDLLERSLERLLAANPRRVYLTHFGALDDVERLGRLQLALLREMVAIGQRRRHADRRAALLAADLEALYTASLREHGCALPASRIAELLALDVGLNAQGIEAWLDRESRRERA
jgi:glyoxylase-like metal-dependent hydrolase (beta-lactamase superfamily II)